MVPQHIISWGANERPLSPVSTSSASVLSIESITSDTSSTLPEPSRATQYRIKSMDFSGALGKRESDGNITFLVDAILYCVHRYFFSRDSPYFSTRLDQLGIREHEPLSIIISLGDVEPKDFDALLSVLYPECGPGPSASDFEEHSLSYEQWKSVLHLSTRWGFASLRRLALKSINPPTPFDQLLLARAYSVDDWVSSALTALCERTVPLSLSEARQMTIEDIMLITTVREGIRPHALQVDPGEIPNCIEAVQIGMHAGGAGPGAPPSASSLSLSSSSSLSLMMEGETPTSPSGSTTVSNNGTGQSARSTMAAGANDASEKVGSGDGGQNREEEEDEDAETAVALSPVDGVVRRRANLNLKGEGEVTGPGENGIVRSAEKSSRPARGTSAWGKILVVPSPTLSHAPHSPQAWGLPTDADEPPHEEPGWLTRARVKKVKRKSAPRHSSPPPLPPKPFGGQLQDSGGDGD
ncbi:hypothetical protein BC827DRAFT_1320245 [Russula dissimulans]|nr:hypothetical protein BC827DRAFT_1320245 [Russula dissimulans]